GQGSFAADLADVLHRHSGGNALFVSALVRDLVANGTLVQENDRWMLTVPIGSVEPRVPASLQDMLDVQFDQLPATEHRALSAASAIGDRFLAPLLAGEGAGLDEMERVCEALVERRLFIRPAGITDLPNGTMCAQYEFRHALYRQAIYGRLSDVARIKLHRAAGERLESSHGPRTSAAAEIAAHFEKAHEYERAIQYLALAAANAASAFAVRDSLDVLQHAMSLVPDLPSDRRSPIEIQLLERIGDAHYALGAMVESALAYETECAVATRAGLIAAQVQAQS